MHAVDVGLSYAAGLAGGRKEQWVNNVLMESPGGAFFGSDGLYYETPTEGRSLSVSQRARILGGSVLSSLGLAAAVITGVGILGTTVKSAWDKAVTKSKEAATRLLQQLSWRRGRSPFVGSVASRLLKEQADEGVRRQVLLMVYDENPLELQGALAEGQSSSSSSGGSRSSNRDVADWLQQRLAAQLVLPPLDIFKKPFSKRYQTVSNTRGSLTVADFVRGLLRPPCRAAVERQPELLSLFSLFMAEPTSSGGRTRGPHSADDTPWQGEEETAARLHLLSPSLPMRLAVSLLNAHRGGTHFVISVDTAADVEDRTRPRAITPATLKRSRDSKLTADAVKRCFQFKKKPPVNLSSATVSVSPKPHTQMVYGLGLGFESSIF